MKTFENVASGIEKFFRRSEPLVLKTVLFLLLITEAFRFIKSIILN